MKFTVKQKILSALMSAAIMTAVISINPAASKASVTIRDIDAGGDFAKASIVSLADGNIISGDENGYFHPLGAIKRSEMVKIIVNAMNIDTSSLPENPTFADVPRTHWAFEYVEAAYAAGIVKGVTPGLFGADANCTREEMATMYVRALGLTDNDMKGKQPYLYLNNMVDKDKVSSWAKENVEFALSTGLMQGTGGNRFDARSSAERQQVAVVTDRLITNRDAINRFAGTFTGEMPYPELFNALEENSRHYKGNFDLNLQMSVKDDSDENNLKVTMGAKGMMDADTGENLMNFDISYDVGASLSDEDLPSISQQFQVIKLDDKYYVREPGSDIWTLGDQATLDQFGVTAATAGQNSEELAKLYRYSTITKEADADLNGVAATKYTMVFNKEAMKALLTGIADEQAAAEEGQLPAQINDAEGTIVVYLDAQNRIIHQEFNLTGSTFDETLGTNLHINVLLEADYYNIGQDVDIKAPEIAEPETTEEQNQ